MYDALTNSSSECTNVGPNATCLSPSEASQTCKDYVRNKCGCDSSISDIDCIHNNCYN